MISKLSNTDRFVVETILSLFSFGQFGHISAGDPAYAGIQFKPNTISRLDVVHSQFDIATAALHVPGAGP